MGISKLSGKPDEILGVTCDSQASQQGDGNTPSHAMETGISSGGVGHLVRV